jgi:hypothetical protein
MVDQARRARGAEDRYLDKMHCGIRYLVFEENGSLPQAWGNMLKNSPRPLGKP